MNPFGDPLELHPRRSLQLALAVLGLHGLAVAMMIAVSLRFPLLLAALAPILLSAAWYWRRQRQGSSGDVIRLSHRVDGTWRWECADGRIGIGQVAGSSVYTRRLVILHLHARDKWRLHLLLLPDSLDDDGFRRLRARLRLTAGAS